MDTTKHYLAARGNWQDGANKGGKHRENIVADTLKDIFEKEEPGFELEKQPRMFDQLYLEVDYAMDPESYKKPAEEVDGAIWYDTTKKGFYEYKKSKSGKFSVKRSLCGIIPDLMIKNKTNGKMHFAEVKNQNDAGNAHERCGKYATDIVHHMKKKIGVSHHPISYIFGGSLVTKRKYILELKACYNIFAPGHLVMLSSKEATRMILLDWFRKVVKPLLE